MQQRNLLLVFFILLLTGLAVWVNVSIPPRLGLDLAGGIRFTIQADTSQLPADQRTGDAWAEKARIVIQTLERRAQQGLGVSEATVYRKGEDRFVVELPGFSDESEARDIITTSARLEYYWARNVDTDLDTTRPYYARSDDGETRFYRKGQPDPLEPGSREFQMMISNWDLITVGDTLISAQPSGQLAAQGTYSIDLRFNVEGTRQLDQFAMRVMNRKENLAAVLDNEVVSFAHLVDGFRTQGTAVLTGNFTAAEALRIAGLLNAGALPVDLSEENVNLVNPSIGIHALGQIIQAGMIAFVVISAFLLVYYMLPGLVAFIALIIYSLLCYAVFKWIGVTFSLAAIAGFILSIGMAVDANILIFERLKEELRAGRTILTAIDLGFKRAFPAIVDTNACTIITCIVLANIGTGPVKGFATTLMIGVLLSFFTAVTVSRTLLFIAHSFGLGKNPSSFGLKRGWFGEHLEAAADVKPLAIVQNMKRYFIISFAIIAPGLLFVAMGGLKPNVEFLGGVESAVYLPPEMEATSASVNARLRESGIVGMNTKIADGGQVGPGNIAYITIPLEDNPDLAALLESESTQDILRGRQRIVEAAGGDATVLTREEAAPPPTIPAPEPDEDAAATEEAPPDEEAAVPPDVETAPEDAVGIAGEVSFESTGPAVREETIRGAIIGVVLAATLIILYLAIRFGLTLGGFAVGVRFGMSAVIAMIHDVLVIVGLAAAGGYFLGWEVSQLTITAVLTVIGFSVHDSIVIFDRIRENLRRPHKGELFDNLVNRSITQSFARSINTSAVVVVTLGILAVFGSATPDLKHFNYAMLVGILSGTYSSIFNAAPILVLWERAVARRKGPDATIMQDKRLREPADDADRTVWKREDEGENGGADDRYSQTKRRKR